MPADPANELTFSTIRAPISSATNNAASNGFDIRGYTGKIAVRVQIGVKTAGDNDGAITVKIQHAANNTAAEAVDLAVGNVATTNNTTASGTLSVPVRGTNRYIFARIIIAGTNSPAYPVAIDSVGVKKVQP